MKSIQNSMEKLVFLLNESVLLDRVNSIYNKKFIFNTLIKIDRDSRNSGFGIEGVKRIITSRLFEKGGKNKSDRIFDCCCYAAEIFTNEIVPLLDSFNNRKYIKMIFSGELNHL